MLPIAHMIASGHSSDNLAHTIHKSWNSMQVGFGCRSTQQPKRYFSNFHYNNKCHTNCCGFKEMWTDKCKISQKWSYLQFTWWCQQLRLSSATCQNDQCILIRKGRVWRQLWSNLRYHPKCAGYLLPFLQSNQVFKHLLNEYFTLNY